MHVKMKIIYVKYIVTSILSISHKNFSSYSFALLCTHIFFLFKNKRETFPTLTKPFLEMHETHSEMHIYLSAFLQIK